ncbi:diguanylate cyclase [Demequina sp. NBRC 110056]|uniref:GGDEF domain-containing protein n=1 Tax=Demequina sp. NBRC 110056 TaxID=1570345 RepID=UPI000A048EC3|nr:GGDEF domain-containing protein [Demequina sp. NBRC 110056]
MLDVPTLRVVLGGVSLLVLVLFYLAVYRPTRSAFSGWWTIALVATASGSSLLLLNGTDAQVVANPLSGAASAVGATAVWFAARSVRGLAVPRWLMPVGAIFVVAAAALERPASSVWAGDGVEFAYMGAMFVLAAREMWSAWRSGWGEDRPRTVESQVATLVSALAASILAVQYVLRFVLYVAVGPEGSLFLALGGPGVTAVVMLLSLVAVTFSASALGWEQQTVRLRQRAITDDLTGLLGRREFWHRAQEAIERHALRGGPAPALVIADLDHFKAVNDGYGHAAGDRAIVQFARTLRDATGRREFAGRLGGEEFGAVILVADAAAAAARAEEIAAAYASTGERQDFPLPTVSFGIAVPSADQTLDELFADADAALYEAKQGGRDQAVVAGG